MREEILHLRWISVRKEITADDEFFGVIDITSRVFNLAMHELENFLQRLICCEPSRIAQFICKLSFSFVIRITMTRIDNQMTSGIRHQASELSTRVLVHVERSQIFL